MLRLFTEEEQNERAFLALTRFLDALDEREPQPGRRPALDPLVLSFQLKLLWLSGFLAAPRDLRRVRLRRTSSSPSTRRRAGRSAPPATAAASRSRPRAGTASLALLGAPIADATALGLGDRAARDVLAVVASSYEHHGGFRLRTLSA